MTYAVSGRFRDWITTGIREYGFIQDEDFRVFFRESNNGRPSKEYSITINMAKELSMVAKTKKGTRDTLSANDLDRLESVESIIRGLVKAGKQYKEIKESLLPIFKELS